MFTLRLFTQNGSFLLWITLVLGFVSRQPSLQAEAIWLVLICSQYDGSLIIEGDHMTSNMFDYYNL